MLLIRPLPTPAALALPRSSWHKMGIQSFSQLSFMGLSGGNFGAWKINEIISVIFFFFLLVQFLTGC